MKRLRMAGVSLVLVLAFVGNGLAVSPFDQGSRPASPQAVVILVDAMSVMGSPRNLGELRAGVASAVRKALGASDRVAVGTFAGRTKMSERLTPANEDIKAVLNAVFDVPWGERFGNCLIWDALLQAVDMLEAAPDGTDRRVILLTAARGSGNVATPSDVEKRARAAHVEVSVMFRPTYRRPMAQQDSGETVTVMPELLLQSLVNVTAGTFVESRDRDELSVATLLESLLRRTRPG